eukprot:gb/GFBE01021908.1/.p1 GENE.gb/GFBE01021908.1/~~gb/GFBE01021908.1/.p1  ORF type:complete len:734 (+),score=132.47 gb/GFBE01021908.1/:1-2202(+)
MRAREATVTLRAEVTSPTGFSIQIEGACTVDAREAIIEHVDEALDDCADFVREQLSSFDRCQLDAHRYLPLHQALMARGRSAVGGPFYWSPLPNWVVDALPSFSRKDVACKVPASIWLPRGLMPYQQAAVRRAMAQDGSVLLADEMGLGKTAQALAIIAQYLDHEGPALVVTPSSLGAVWRQQAKQWLPQLKPSEIQIATSVKDSPRSHAKLVIVSYALFVRAKAFYTSPSNTPWQIVVCDEAHCLRNPTSQRGKALLPVLHGARRRVLITGTPTPKQASEAYTLVHALRHLGCNFQEWCARYGKDRTEHREAEVAALLLEVMVRRAKADVLDQLPQKRRQRVELQLSTAAATTLRKLQSQAASSNAVADDQHFRQLAQLKQAAVQEYIDYVLDASNEKFLLFAHHISMLDALTAALTQRGVTNIRIDGSTKVDERPKLVQRFQEQPSCRVAVLSILAAGEGLTLTAASRVLFCELCPAVPGVIEQAEARVHRLGQKAGSVDVQFLVVEGTRDDVVFRRLEERESQVEKVLGEILPQELSLKTDTAAAAEDSRTSTQEMPAKSRTTRATSKPPAGVPARKRLRKASLESFLDADIDKAQDQLGSGKVAKPAPSGKLDADSSSLVTPPPRSSRRVRPAVAALPVHLTVAPLPQLQQEDDSDDESQMLAFFAGASGASRVHTQATVQATSPTRPAGVTPKATTEIEEPATERQEEKDPLSSLLDELIDSAQSKTH